MKLISITAMDCYKNKSFDELRWEDYQANRSQPAGAVASGPTGWGAPQPSSTPAAGGLFGSVSTPSTTGGGLFGQPAAAPTGGLFGSSTPSQPASGGLFGSAPAQTSGGLFGQQQPATTSSGLFGQQQTTSQPTSGGLFGQSSSTGGGLFGSSTPAALPSQPSTGGLFGSSMTPQPSSSTGGGLFGSTAPASTGGGLFGSSTQQPASTGGGLFGSSTTPSTGGGLFGSTSSAGGGGGLFGTSTTTTQPSTGGGLFGTSSTPASGGGLFGSSTTTTGGGLFGSSTTTSQPSGGGGLFGTSTTPSTSGGGLFGTSTTTSTGGGGLFGTSQPATSGGGLFGSSTMSALPSSSTGGLFGTSTPATPAAPGTGLGFAQGGLFGSTVTAAQPSTLPSPPVPRPTGLVAPKPIDKDSLSAFLWKDRTGEATTPLVKKKLPTSAPVSPPSPRTFVPKPSESTTPLPALAAVPEIAETPARLGSSPPPSSKAPVVRPKIFYTTPTKETNGSGRSTPGAKSVMPICANHNLWTKPSLEAMAGMTEQELSRVEHFQIGQYGVGSVTWPGLTDVRFLAIDDIIQFKKGAVTLFPDEDLKPPVGTGLNKTAIIELFVRPKNFDLAKKYESRYVQEMKKLTESNGAEFLSYDLETWRFRVEHFSTWGIDESEWMKIDAHHEGLGGGAKNDLSLFSRLEQDLFTPEDDEEVEEETSRDDMATDSMDEGAADNANGTFSREDFVGALAVAPPTREELKAMGWDLRILDLFLNQSFRVAMGLEGDCFLPEHPVVYDSHKISKVENSDTVESAHEIEALILALVGYNHNISDWSELVSHIESRAGRKFKSVFSLIRALLDAEEGSADNSPASTGPENINTAAFNEWLSKINADLIQANPALSFSPSATMSSRHYSPSASELLVNSGYPRLALATAAAIDDTSRRLMRDQMSKIKDSDKSLQQVADIIGGHCDRLKSGGLDWKAELALRYWYNEGDLSGFEPPEDSLEWRIIKSVVLSSSSELFKLSEVGAKTDLFLVFVSLFLLKLKKDSLVDDVHLHRVAIACSDFALANSDVLNWQLSPVILSFLPESAHRDQLIADIVGRNIDRDCSLIEKYGIMNLKDLTGARAAKEMSEGRIDTAKTLLVKEGFKKESASLMQSIPTSRIADA